MREDIAITIRQVNIPTLWKITGKIKVVEPIIGLIVPTIVFHDSLIPYNLEFLALISISSLSTSKLSDSYIS